MKFRTKILLFGIITLPAITGACALGLLQLFRHTHIDLAKLTNPPPQSIVYDGAGKVYMKIGTPPSNLNYNEIPSDLRNAIVATEDHAYWTSSSINIKSIFRSILVDIQSNTPSQGASTIQEQLAKIVYLNDNKTLTYKLKEIALGVELGRYYTKKEILAMYLNKVFLGENAIGVRQAALRYFGIDIAQHPGVLTLDEAALLAGLPQAPSAYDPLRHPHKALERRNEVLQNMKNYGYISASQAAIAEKAPLGATFHDISQSGWNTHPLFTNVLFDYAKRQGISEAQLLQGGLKIYTTINPAVQSAVHTVFWSKNYNNDFPGPTSGTVVQGAAVFVDPKTGGIEGAAGSRQEDYTRLGIDRIYSNSSPGSSIKPIMEYAPAIQLGTWTPLSILNNQPQDFGGGYTPVNWEGATGPKKVTLQYGLQWSQNIASVWLLQQIGIQTGAQFAMNDGIPLTNLDRQHLGIAIGGMQDGVNPVEMAQAYEPFANSGVQVGVHLITKILNQNGDVIYQPTITTKTVMSTSTANTMTRLLQDVVDFGTGTSAQVSGWSVAGKTGTVQYSSGLTGYNNWIRTAWFDGYTPNLVGSIYIGYDQSSPQYHMTMAPLDPSANAAKIFGDITRLALQTQTPEHFAQGPFPASQGTATAATSLENAAIKPQAVWNPILNGVSLTWKTRLAQPRFTITRTTIRQKGTSGNSSTTFTTYQLSYFDQTTQPGVTYQYVIQAIDGNGAVLGHAATVFITTPQGSNLAGTSNPVGNNNTAGATIGPGLNNATNPQNGTGTTNATGTSNVATTSHAPGPNNTVG